MTNAAPAPAAALKLARILAPVDFTEPCRRATLDAESLARHFGAELVLLHAVPPVGLPLGPAEALAYANAAEMTMERVTHMTPVLEEFLADELRGIATRRVLVESDPVRAILDYTAERPCDLIVMPTHGYGALHRIVLGSVTAEVLHDAPCPVWTGCRFEQRHAAFRTVLCGVDFASRLHAVVQWAAGFVHEFAAAFHLLHAVPESMVRSGAMYFDPEYHGHVSEEARRRMTEAAADAGATPDMHVPLGDVPTALADAARELKADLLVVGRGPKTYAIIRAAPCPVVVV